MTKTFFAGIAILSITLLHLSCKKNLSCEGCADGNKAPIATAGPDQVITLPTDSVVLDGSSSSDPDGMISEWLWRKISGPASFNIRNASSAKTVVRDLVAGTYQFELSITDKDGLSAKDTVLIIAGNPTANQPPTAIAGADSAINLPANTMSLNGSRSVDPENSIASYTWTKIAGPTSFTISNADLPETQVNNLVEGAYQFELKVTDAGGLFSRDTVIIIVNTTIETKGGLWEVIIRLPIDSVFVDDYYRDTEKYHVVKISGPASCIIDGGWAKRLVPGEYLFGRYIDGFNTTSEIIKVTVLDDANERNTITYKNLLWEYNYAWNFDGWFPHLFLSRPKWNGIVNQAIEVSLQMDFLNQGNWFNVPSTLAGYDFSTDCRGYNSVCMTFFIVKAYPENRSWDGKTGSLKIKLL